MIRIDCIWLASFVLSTSNLRGGIDKLLAQVVHGFALGAQTHHAYVFANWRADRLKVLVFNVFGMWLCTRRLQSGSLRGRARTRAPWSSAVSSSTVDTAFKDRAAEDAKLPAPSPPRANGQAMRQALPASLPRIEHLHEIPETHRACGQAVERIGREVSEQLNCVPAPFFVLRHIRSKYA
jgi:transposase